MKLNLLWATLRLMTRFPVSEKWADGVEFRQLGRGVPYFPLVGLFVGVVAALAALLVSQTGGGIYLGAAVWALAMALLTGGFHLDGLADTCDGIFSARSRERMLAIMKDSRLGTFGGLALIFCILLKVMAVTGLSSRPPAELFALLVCAPVVSRAGLVLGMYGQRYAREGEGLGTLYIGGILFHEAAITLLIGALIVVALTGLHGVAAMVVTWGLMACLVRYLRTRLGGQTGDTLGALAETGETLFLLALMWS
ncbi:adenosylcobinamide-GDP ribazoletransferase [Leclercia pneumoniae]|uniref:adenosylcobinamide-GDP ribazoletransferase n=1 Tax=Leclercia pneumoniae TaxID=2815358 RepID=UPI002DB62941|nr:adenosylcobinamide-GDP ribazoletransferase [Leclercia pneumoniae]MEB7501367.1 adenosylcobinamide-GDP ribazoletransferase [Leclercia pneumoniae]